MMPLLSRPMAQGSRPYIAFVDDDDSIFEEEKKEQECSSSCSGSMGLEHSSETEIPSNPYTTIVHHSPIGLVHGNDDDNNNNNHNSMDMVQVPDDDDDDDEENPPSKEAISPVAEMVTTSVLVELTEEQVRRNRTFMTVVHFLLTYPRWSFSLFLLLAAGGGGMEWPTLNEAVQIPMANVQALVRMESQAYYQCAVHTFQQLETLSHEEEPSAQTTHAHDSSGPSSSWLHQVANRAWQTSLDRRRYNRETILQNQVMPMVQTCHQDMQQAQQAFTQWYLLQSEQPPNSDENSVPRNTVPIPWINTITNITNTNNTDASFDSLVCTAQDQELLIGLSGNGSGHRGALWRAQEQEAQRMALTNQLHDELVAWRSRTLILATRLSDYAQNRSSYDYHYFVGAKVARALQLLQEWQVKMGQLLYDHNLALVWDDMWEPDVLAQLDMLLQTRVLNVLQDAKVRIDILETRLKSFYISLEAFRVHYQDVIERLKLSSAFVKDFLPPSVSLPSYMDLSNIPIVQGLLPTPVYALPQFDVATVPTVDLDALVHSIVHLLNRTMVHKVGLWQQQVNLSFQSLFQELLTTLEDLFTLQDYDPPKYQNDEERSNNETMNEDLDRMDQENQEAQERILQLLQEAIMVTEATTDWNEQVHQGHQALDGTASNLEQITKGTSEPNGFPTLEGGANTTSFDYLEPSFPTFSVPPVLELVFAIMFAHQWLVEIIIQFIRIVRLKQKYERNATPDLPEIDLVTEEDEESDSGEELEGQPQAYYKDSSWSFIRLALLEHLFLTPWMMIGLFLLPFALLGVFFWFPHVKQSCIESRDGTFVARNMIAPILINKANVAGNAHYTRAEFQCRRLQRNLCSVWFHESEQLYRSDWATLQRVVKTYNESMIVGDRLGRCLDVSFLDHAFSEACCGLEGYSGSSHDAQQAFEGMSCQGPGIPELCPIDNVTLPPSAFPPIGQLLGRGGEETALASCWPSGWWEDLLVDSRFDCTELLDDSLCGGQSCSGVNSDRILEATIEADCQVELYVVKCCVLVLLALYHGVMVNLITSLAFNGVKRIRWRKLKPNGIKFRTHVDEADGELVKGSDPQDRLDRIQLALRRFQRVGQIQIVLSVVLFVAWLVSFLVLRWQVHQRLFSVYS